MHKKTLDDFHVPNTSMFYLHVKGRTHEGQKTSRTVKRELHLQFNPIVEAGTIINRTARGIMGNTLLR